jgi:excisionase family DNA binding protein
MKIIRPHDSLRPAGPLEPRVSASFEESASSWKQLFMETTLIDINELSRRLSIPKGTLYNWVYLRRIPFIKAGRCLRFDPAEVIHSLTHSPKMDLAGKG